MQNNHPAAASDSQADDLTQLAEFVAANRQRLPKLPDAVPVRPVLTLQPTDPAILAAKEAEAAKRALVRERASRQANVTRLIQQAGHRYSDCTVENFVASIDQQRKVKQAVVEYCEMLRDSWESTNLVLYGPVGTGKDHLAIAIGKMLIIELGKRVEWVNGQAWFGTLRDAMDGNTPEATLISRLSSPDVLILSDPAPPIGTLTQHQATMLYRVIDARYSRGVPTICTLNVKDDSEADALIGVATWDRLCHGAWKIRCAWPSHRTARRKVE